MAPIGAEKSDEKFIGKNKKKKKRKKNKKKKQGHIMGMVNMRMPILLYTIQVIPNVCTKFQNPRWSSSWEIYDTNLLCNTFE